MWKAQNLSSLVTFCCQIIFSIQNGHLGETMSLHHMQSLASQHIASQASQKQARAAIFVYLILFSNFRLIAVALASLLKSNLLK